ncbi:caspase domain-containing protein [Streptomyces sp. NPDC059679]|uniref:caspase family protein n=1 Tax=Streptomyces sp. NPDC059679 TaxID=3346903 RepID=UPI0036795999
MGLPDPRRSRAVLIGTRSYTVESGLAELPGVTGNVIQLGRLLTTLTGLPADHCRSLLDRTEDREVCQEVRKAAREADDLLLVYFAGHGLIDPETNELFLALSGSNPDEPLYTAVRFSEIREAVAASRARNRVIILDCCYSGRAIVDTMGTDAAAIAFGQTETSGAYTLTATSANLPAIARAGERHTVFTGKLLELLQEGIADAGPHLTLDRVYDELRRTLAPRPRRQGTDSVGELGLVRNARHGASSTAAAEGTGGGETTEDAARAPREPVMFRTNTRRLMWRRALLYLGLAGPPVVAAILYVAFVANDDETLVVSFTLAPAVSMMAVALSDRVLFLVPRIYELTIGEEGLLFAVQGDKTWLRWSDVQQMMTVRGRPGHDSPHWLAVRTRRGFIPPRRSRPFHPRMDRRRNVLVLCNLRYVQASPGEVEAAIASFAGPLWDDGHGLSEATHARFGRGRKYAANVAAAWLGLAVTAFAVWVDTSGTARWITVFFGVAIAALLLWLSFLPVRVELDDQVLRLRYAHRSTCLSWDSITEVRAISDASLAESFLLIVTAPRGERWSLPYDPRFGGMKMGLTNVAATPGELSAAFTRFAGERWRGYTDEFAVTAEAFGARAVFKGRLGGNTAVAVAVAAPIAVLLAGTWAILAMDFLAAAWGVLPILALLSAMLSIPFYVPLELHIDDDAMELIAGRRRTRIPWSELSRVEVMPPLLGPGHTPSIVVWFKEGADVPPRWRWGGCFRPWSGGVIVTHCGLALTGLQESAAQVDRALARFAGPAWTRRP